MLIVNGPIRKQLEINDGFNLFGQGWRANATIGRTLRLVCTNIGGALPGELDRAAFGHAGKYTCCIAEKEEASPWDGMHVDRGSKRRIVRSPFFAEGRRRSANRQRPREQHRRRYP